MTSTDLSDEHLDAIDAVRVSALAHLDSEMRDYQDFLNTKAQHLRDEFSVWFDAEIDKLQELLV